jgi:hypothetical protein
MKLINELRIGNFVQGKQGKNLLVVTEIMASGITYDRHDGLAVAGHCQWNEIEPIWLHTLWLPRFGFTRGHDSNVWMLTIDYADTDYPCTLQRSGDGFQICRSGIGAKTAILEHVHSLQNLYYSLVGKELVFTATESIL